MSGKQILFLAILALGLTCIVAESCKRTRTRRAGRWIIRGVPILLLIALGFEDTPYAYDYSLILFAVAVLVEGYIGFVEIKCG